MKLELLGLEICTSEYLLWHLSKGIKKNKIKNDALEYKKITYLSFPFKGLKFSSCFLLNIQSGMQWDEIILSESTDKQVFVLKAKNRLDKREKRRSEQDSRARRSLPPLWGAERRWPPTYGFGKTSRRPSSGTPRLAHVSSARRATKIQV